MMICIPIVAKISDSAIRKMAKAHTLADVIEIRLDLMEEMGGHMTFAALDSGEESASGQISVHQMKEIWELLSS